MTSLSDGTTTQTILGILGWSDDRAGAAVIHDVVGRPDPVVTLRAARARSGSFDALCADMAEGWALRELLTGALVFHLTNTDLPQTDMDFVIDGVIHVELDTVTLIRAVVTVDFREIYT